MITRLPMQETQETWVRSLGWEAPLEKEMVTHTSILAWRIPWTEEPGGLQFMESHRVRLSIYTHHEQIILFLCTFCLCVKSVQLPTLRSVLSVYLGA